MLEVFANARRFKLSRPLGLTDENMYVSVEGTSAPIIPWGSKLRLVLEGSEGVEVVSATTMLPTANENEYELYAHERGLEDTIVQSWPTGTVIGNRWTAEHATRAFNNSLQLRVVNADHSMNSGEFCVVLTTGVVLYPQMVPVDGEVIGFCNATDGIIYVNWVDFRVRGVLPSPMQMVIPPGGSAILRYIESEGMWV